MHATGKQSNQHAGNPFKVKFKRCPGRAQKKFRVYYWVRNQKIAKFSGSGGWQFQGERYMPEEKQDSFIFTI